MRDIDVAVLKAITLAKKRGANEVLPDDLLLGCLWVRSHFGVVKLGQWAFDLEALGIDWMAPPPDKSTAKVSYSDEVVVILDRAARIARAGGLASMQLEHVLAAFANEESDLMSKLKREFQINSSAWRLAVAELLSDAVDNSSFKAEMSVARDYLTPEEAAAALSIHVQTLRAYVRSGKLPALRLAGERAIRIRRVDLDKVLEPVQPEK